MTPQGRNTGEDKAVVYGLVDPRSNRVRYVGLTRTPIERFNAHAAKPKTLVHPRDQWIQELLDEGQEPLMILFGIYEMPRAREIERNFIELLAQGDADLTNVYGVRLTEAVELRNLGHAERTRRQWARAKAAGFKNLREAWRAGFDTTES